MGNKIFNMSQRKSKPINVLLKMLSIDPNLKFTGADAEALDEFMAEQQRVALFNAGDSQPSKPTARKTARRRKVKQTIATDDLTIGEVVPNAEPIDSSTQERVPSST